MAVFERKSLFRLTLPLLLYSFLSITVTFIDTILLSMYSDELAAAVSIANQILGIAYDLSGLLAVGAVILVAQYLGKDDITSAQRVSVIAIAANTLFSLAIAMVLFVGGPAFVDWVNTPPEIVAEAELYIYIVGFAMIFNGFIVASTAVLRGFGHTVAILVLGILANIVYLFLEYVLIFGHWGFPELGVAGAALSTLIVRVASIGFLIYVLNRKLKFNWRKIASTGQTWSLVKKLTRISSPSVGDNIAYNFYQLTMVSFITAFGVASVLTRSYVLTVTAFLSLITYVISQGNEVLVGYDKGSGDHPTARRRAIKTSIGTGAVTTLIAVLAFIFSDQLIGLFTEDPEILARAHTVLLINILLVPCQSVNVMLFNSLKAVGDVYWPVAYSLGVTFLLALPLGYLFVVELEYGVAGLWCILVIEELIKAMIMYTRWRRMHWVRYHMVDEPVQVTA